ncbi:MAG: DinB family protein [Chloroflexota bacterium]
MTRSLLADAFDHHVWATIRVIDACAALTADQLETTVPGTFGSILETVRHTVGADAAYVSVLSGGRVPGIDEATMDLAALRATMERHAPVWTALLEEDLDPDASIVRHRDDGSTSTAPLGVRIAQVTHHGTDHRSQVCTALTSLGITPPAIDVWDFADTQGRLGETPPTA